MKKIMRPVNNIIIMLICTFFIVKLVKGLQINLNSSTLVYSEILINVLGLFLWIWPFVLCIRYFYLRFTGKSDGEIYPSKKIPGLIELNKGTIEFGGSAKYNSIPLASIEDISYQPTDNDYQEVKITKKCEGTYIYHLVNSKEYLYKKVQNINNLLQREACSSLI